MIHTVIIGAHKCPGLVVGAVDVIPPAGLPVVLVIAHHLQAVLLRPSVRFSLGEVCIGPGFMVQPPPAPLQVLVSSAQEYRVVEVGVSCTVKKCNWGREKRFPFTEEKYIIYICLKTLSTSLLSFPQSLKNLVAPLKYVY